MKGFVTSSRIHQVTTSLPLSVASERLSLDILYTPKSTETTHVQLLLGVGLIGIIFRVKRNVTVENETCNFIITFEQLGCPRKLQAE